MKGGIFRKLYMKVRLFFLGLEFPLEDKLFDCRHADFQGALAQDLLRVFKKGFCLDGEISMIGKDEDGFFRCEIRIFDRASFMLPYLPDLPYLTSVNNE